MNVAPITTMNTGIVPPWLTVLEAPITTPGFPDPPAKDEDNELHKH